MLAGCVSSSGLRSGGIVRADPPDDPSYGVLVRNASAVGFDGDVAADRVKVVRSTCGSQCPDLTFTETPMTTGKFNLGGPG
jgi:hypothetical protein